MGHKIIRSLSAKFFKFQQTSCTTWSLVLPSWSIPNPIPQPPSRQTNDYATVSVSNGNFTFHLHSDPFPMIAIVVPQCLIITLFHTVKDPIRIDIIWFLEQVPTDHSRKIDCIVFIIPTIWIKSWAH
jgi:hypothetical protein